MSLLPITHHQQDQQADCLAACAAMVLSYLQVSVTYETLIKRLRIGYAGAPFRNLRYLESLGVSVEIRQGSLDMLRLHLKEGMPPIVFLATQELSYWNEGTNHALVVVGIDEKLIYLNDPHFADALKAFPLLSLTWLGLKWKNIMLS